MPFLNTHTHRLEAKKIKKCAKTKPTKRNTVICQPVDQNDTLAKLDKVPEGEGKPPGQLFYAGESLDSWLRPAAAALLLLLKSYKQLEGAEKNRSVSLPVTEVFRCVWRDNTCCKLSTSVRALSILSICLVRYIVSLMMSPKSL